MNLGTVAYENEIYNLDYMTSDEIKNLINTVENVKEKSIKELKEPLKTEE